MFYLYITVTKFGYDHTVFTFVLASSLIITLHCTVAVSTVAVLPCIKLLFYRSRQRLASNFSSISFRCSVSQGKLSPSKMHSHGISRPKPQHILTLFPFITTFPQLLCLFQNLDNQVAICLSTWPMTSNSLFNIYLDEGRRDGSFFGPAQVLISQRLQHLRPSHLPAHA